MRQRGRRLLHSHSSARNWPRGKPIYTHVRRMPAFTKEATRDYAAANIVSGSIVVSAMGSAASSCSAATTHPFATASDPKSGTDGMDAIDVRGNRGGFGPRTFASTGSTFQVDSVFTRPSLRTTCASCPSDWNHARIRSGILRESRRASNATASTPGRSGLDATRRPLGSSLTVTRII